MHMTRIALFIALILLPYSYSAALEPAPADSVGGRGEGIATDSISTLDEFVVETRKKLVKSDGATLTYDVAEDPEKGSSPIIEILRKVPGVTIDADDNIKVNGQSNFKVLMNGKEDPMLTSDLKSSLRSIPASTIQRIEVIKEPGAKYDAEGTGGILNIVTVSGKRLDGYMVTSNLRFGSSGFDISANARTKIHNVTMSIQPFYSNGQIYHKYLTQDSERENKLSETDRLLKSHRRLRCDNYNYTGVNFNASWEPDTLNLFTLSLNFSDNGTSNPFVQTNEMFAADGSLTWLIKRRTKSRYNGTSAGGMLSYQHTLGRQDHTIVASYNFGYYGSDNFTLIDDYERYNAPTDYIFSKNDSKGDSMPHTIQLDYTNKINGHYTLEAGLKGYFYTNSSNDRAFFGMSEADLIENQAQHMKLTQFRDIMAAYTTVSVKYGSLSGRAGLRYEHTHMGIRYKVAGYDNFTSNLNDFVPNASVSYSLTEASSLRAAYQMRISRPGLGTLNPFVNNFSQGQISYGNPDLESEKLHKLRLTYSNYDHPLTGEVSANYYFQRNGITDIIFSKDGVINTTYANVGKEKGFSADLSLNWNPTSRFSCDLWTSATYEHLSADSELLSTKKHYWQTFFYAGANYTFPCKIRVSLWGNYWTAWQDLQSKGENSYYYGLGVSRSFLKDDALTLSLSAQNIVPAVRTNGYTQESETARVYSSTRRPYWGVNLGVSFRFGSLKQDVKRTANKIEGESEASGGSKGN